VKARIYSVADADMLMASATIAENAIVAKDFLQTKRPAWADPFFPNLQARINKAFPDILGISKYSELKDTTIAFAQCHGILFVRSGRKILL